MKTESKTESLIQLEPNQWHKHNFIKTFFLLNVEQIEAVYIELNGSLNLNAKKWRKYVESKELFDLIYPLIYSISEFTRNAIAFSEPVEFLGNEMQTDECEVYYAVPLATLHDNMRVINENAEVMKYATRCFITMLNHMFFKHLYKEPFMILRGINETASGWIRLDDDLVNHHVL